MLVRSSSTPLLHSWMPELSLESEPHPRISRSHSIPLVPHLENPARKVVQVRPETDLREHMRSSSFGRSLKVIVAVEEEEEVVSLGYSATDRLFSSSGLDEVVVEEDGVGGGIGRNNASGRFNGDGFGDGEGDATTDAYYRKMIQGDPGNGLLLGNYAKFLKEVRGDLVRAEEYCERAILANANDGNIVALYAELIWKLHRDASRAEKYFDQAVQAEPSDCYVMASYARFLWDTEEEEEAEEEDNAHAESCKNLLTRQQPESFQGAVFPSISAY